MSADGKTLKHYSNNDQQLLPHWSPDSQWLTFHNANFPAIVYRMRVADGFTEQLHLSSHPWSGVVWSPDGAWLYYSENDDNGNWDIYRSHPDSTARQRLTSAPSGDVQPIISPSIDQPWHLRGLMVLGGLCWGVGLTLFRYRRLIARS
jgi:Tol biopolymer transport system component